MKKLLTVMLVLAWISQAFAQEYVAVLEFEGSGMSKIEARNVTERFSYNLQQTRKFKIIERQQLDLIIEEQKKQLSGCVADECAVEVGKLAGARYVIAGSVTKTFGLFGINVKLIDVESGEIITQILESDEPDVQNFLNQRVRNAALRLAAEGSQTTKGSNSGSTIAVTSGEKGTVNFSLNKSGAAVFVDGAYTTQASGNAVTLNLAEGVHDIKFTLAGHKDWLKQLNVLAGETLNYEVKFESGKGSGGAAINFGIVMVRSQPDGAMVYLDGVELGPTPAQNTKVAVGKHLVRVEKALYHPYVEEVNILPDGIEQVQADLKANFGSLKITSVPTGAVVQINGQQKGKTPLELPELQSGDYTIQLTKELYHASEEKFTIVDGSANERNIKMNPAYGKLAVNVKPEASDVYLDGQFKGKTPLEIDELPSGMFRLKVSQELYETYESEITIEDGKTLTQTLFLEPRFGTLNITGLPAGAQIAANGKAIGKLPMQNFKLETGLSQIQISAPNYHAHEEFVQVDKNGFYPLNVDLVRHAGTVVSITDPPNAMITLDGETRGLSPQILKDVPTGEHTLIFKHPDFLEETRSFSLGLDERKEFNLKLITYEGSVQQEIDRMAKFRNISLASAGGLILGGVLFNTLSNSTYDEYLSATDADEISTLYEKANSQKSMSGFSYGMGVLALAPAVYFQMDITQMKETLTKPNEQAIDQLEYSKHKTLNSRSTRKSGMNGYTVGPKFGYPVYMSSGMQTGKAAPIMGVVMRTPYGFALGPLEIYAGVEVGAYDFSDVQDFSGTAAIGTLSAIFFLTPLGSISVEVGGGYFGNSVGTIAGCNLNYAVPNLPLVVKPYLRSNVTLLSREGDAVVGGSGMVAWVSSGLYLEYDFSMLF